jgi:hypothetical protein
MSDNLAAPQGFNEKASGETPALFLRDVSLSLASGGF